MISLCAECGCEVNIVSTILLNDTTQISTTLSGSIDTSGYYHIELSGCWEGDHLLGVLCQYYFVNCWRDQFLAGYHFFLYSRARGCCKMKISWTHNVSHNWFFWKLSGHVYYNLFVSTTRTSYQFSQVWFMQYPPALHYGQILEYPTGYPPKPL
jgi:hypothetical protein